MSGRKELLLGAVGGEQGVWKSDAKAWCKESL